MPVIDHIDGPNRDIYLHADTANAEVHPIDIYKEMRTLRRTDETLRKYDVFLKATGKEPKGGGKFTAILVTCLLGTRIIPYDATHELTIIGEIITDEGTSGVACFDRSGLTPGVEVDINYVPPQVEVIEVATGGTSITEQDKLDIANRVWIYSTRGLTTFGTLIADIWNYLTRTLTSSGLTPSEQAELTGIKERTDNLPNNPAAVSDIPTAEENALELLDNQSAPP